MKSMHKEQNERIVTVDGCGARLLGASKVIGWAAVFHDDNWRPYEVYKGRKVTPEATSNMAEFEAILLAMKVIVEKDNTSDRWIIYTDSQYALECWYNNDMAKKEWLKRIVKEWNNLAAQVGWRVIVRWISGEENTDADRASREAIMDANL